MIHRFGCNHLRCLPRHTRRLFSSSSSSTQKSIVVALGGNAIKSPNEKGTYEEMLSNVETATNDIMKLAFDHNYKLAITHGNGPQIGSLYLQNQIASETTPAMPLSICGSMTQGYIGYMLQQSIENQLVSPNIKNNKTTTNISGAISCVTQVRVNSNDKAWKSPSKPVGKFYNEKEAKEMSKEFGYHMMYDSGRGYRYAVASPKPIEIIEIDAIRMLFNGGYVVIACGGGGIPVVVKNDDCNDDSGDKDNINVNGGLLQGRDAVIDKDLTAVVLARELNCDVLMIATDIDGVYLNYLDNGDGTMKEKLGVVKVDDVKKYHKEGQFGKGSMGPKIEAAIQFVQETGNDCIIGALNQIEQCVVGNEGTRIVA